MMTASAVTKRLKTFCKKYDTDAKAAAALRVTAPQLSRTLSGKTNVIPGRILKKLGLQAIVVYSPIVKSTKTAAPEKLARASKPKVKNVSAKPKRVRNKPDTLPKIPVHSAADRNLFDRPVVSDVDVIDITAKS